MKTFVYGDSFNNANFCKCSHDQMWYAPLVQGELIDRTREGASTEEMFLLATNDAVNHSGARFILATGVLYSRLMLYTDQLYDNEQVRAGTLTDCMPYLSTQELEKTLHTGIFHHTLVWAKYLSHTVTLHSLMQSQSHQWFMVHMHTDRNEYQSPANPLVLPLLKHTATMPNYLDHTHSCMNVCQDAGIRPWDYDQYSWSGHHSVEGQQHFGAYAQKMFQDRGLS